MGQAKKRGTFEQRKEEAESRVSFNPAQRQETRGIRVPAKRPGLVVTMLMALLASGVPPKW